MIGYCRSQPPSWRPYRPGRKLYDFLPRLLADFRCRPDGGRFHLLLSYNRHQTCLCWQQFLLRKKSAAYSIYAVVKTWRWCPLLQLDVGDDGATALPNIHTRSAIRRGCRPLWRTAINGLSAGSWPSTRRDHPAGYGRLWAAVSGCGLFVTAFARRL